MLYLHHSNHLEQLAQHFAALQRVDPLPPFQEELVVVQNIGMGRWLSLQTAQYNGISANQRYWFPAELTWELLRMVLDDVPEKDPCAPLPLRWRLFQVFLQETGQWDELDHYLQQGDDAAWQLAGQLAKVFDQYLFFRPEWIREWEQGKGQQDDWQARLWWRVAGEQQLPHWVRLQARFAHALGTLDAARLPQRIVLFSVPVLSPGYMQLLGKVAEYIDIHVYLMNPCEEYWGDIESEKRKQKQRADVQDYISVGNPLLASWGRQGRDFLDLLVENHAVDEDNSLFVPPDAQSLLGQVQADMLYLQSPMEQSEPNPEWLDPQTARIAIHSCHSPMREAEVLYDQLLALFEANPDLQPADVVVMTPDIDRYAPYLDAVFSTAEYPLPYSIADRSPGFAQGILNVCEHLLSLPQGRCDVEEVLALLEFVEVREHLDLDENQVGQCREWIRAVNIRWGANANIRAQQGGAQTHEHTWQYGLDRLLLGYAMPGNALFADILPWNEIEGSQAEVLGRVQQVLLVVLAMADWRQQKRSLAAWDQAFREVLLALVGEDAPLQTVWLALDNLKRIVEQVGFAQDLAWSVFRSALGEQLDKRSESEGFLGRGVTVCALMPMRTVPFRFVALLGMNEGVFPRRDTRASFDRMGDSIKRGDRLKRDEDRYLFLESILSARDWLYISYIGKSQRDDSDLPPSVLVSELLDYLEASAPGSSEQLLTKHRLQPFSQAYLQDDEQGLFTYSTYLQDIPRDVQRQRCISFWQDDVLPPLEVLEPHLALAELIRFYQSPARVFLKQRFGLALGEREETLPIREPFRFEQYQDGLVREQIFQTVLADKAPESVLPLLRAQGYLPHGEPGALLFQEEVATVEQFYAGLEQPLLDKQQVTIRVEIGTWQLQGQISDITSKGRQLFYLGGLSYWHWLDIWLQHLLLNTQTELTFPSETQVFTLDKDKQFKSYQLPVVTNATTQLAQLLRWYQQGLQQPLAFFPKSAFDLYPVDKKTGEVKFKKALHTWEGESFRSRECDRPEYQLLYRDENPLETQHEEFLAIAHAVFGEMFSVRK